MLANMPFLNKKNNLKLCRNREESEDPDETIFADNKPSKIEKSQTIRSSGKISSEVYTQDFKLYRKVYLSSIQLFFSEEKVDFKIWHPKVGTQKYLKNTNDACKIVFIEIQNPFKDRHKIVKRYLNAAKVDSRKFTTIHYHQEPEQ